MKPVDQEKETKTGICCNGSFEEGFDICLYSILSQIENEECHIWIFMTAYMMNYLSVRMLEARYALAGYSEEDSNYRIQEMQEAIDAFMQEKTDAILKAFIPTTTESRTKEG